MFVQVRDRGLKQQEFWVRIAHDLDPVVLWDDHTEAEIREVRSILSAVESVENWTAPWVKPRVRNNLS